MANKPTLEIKGNKGEWSELYVLVKLLVEGRLFQSDMKLQKSENDFYEVVKAYKDEGMNELEFHRKSAVKLYLVSNNKKENIGEFTYDYLGNQAQILYKGIISGKGNAFPIPGANDFIKKASIHTLKAKNSQKADIKLRIYDHRLAKETDLGFSVKSLIGQKSTLFNTGPGNNFIYGVETRHRFSVDEFNTQTYKPSGKISKITYRLQQLIQRYSSTIKFKTIQSSQLFLNLKMTDGDLPEILASSLLYCWTERIKKISEIVELLENHDPLNFYQGKHSKQRLYEYKLKKFLVECALGMTAEKPWNGFYDATGGVIICKKDSDIVCFHIYDFNLLREYLINNTMFEQPATGEDKDNPGNENPDKNGKKYYYGWLYKKEGKLQFKINLQVRFI